MNPQKSETTRYLSAAVYLDAKLRDRVISEFAEEPFRAIGESYGVDIDAVKENSYAARQLEKRRDIPLAILFVVLVIVSLASLFLLFIPFFILFFFIAWSIVYSYERNIQFNVILPRFSISAFRQSAQSLPAPVTPASPSLPSPITPVKTMTQEENVTVYSGFLPFVGAGSFLGGWSVIINVGKGKEVMGQISAPISFQVSELYSQIAHDIAQLRIPGATVSEHLYVSGSVISHDQRFLPDPFARPVNYVSPTVLRTFMDMYSLNARYYLRVRVISWNGEVIFTRFIRFTTIEKKLFIEANDFILPPIKDEYRAIDDLETVPKEIASKTFRSTVSVWFNALKRLSSPSRNKRILQRNREETIDKIKRSQYFDYGARFSLREAASSASYSRFFQRMDKEMFAKTLERQLLESLFQFLDSRNIDTSDFQEQRQTILNSGVIVAGGSLQAENLAVGQQASILGKGGDPSKAPAHKPQP